MKLTSLEKTIFLKCIEELSELSVELAHALNKPKKNNYDKIISEIKDVENYLIKIKELTINSK